MLVSGGKVIAIDGVKTGNTLKGDGVFNTPGSKLEVNTDIIATKEFVTTEDEKVVGKINAASATLSSKIDSVSSTVGSVSSTLNTKINTVSSELSAAIDKKQDQLEFKGEHNRITAIGPSGGTLSSVGGNVVDVKAGNSTTVTTATDEETGITTYTVSLTAQPTDTIVSGENGITSRQNGNTFFVGLNSTYKTNIEKIPGITSDISNLSSNKLDTTAYKPETFYPMEGNPSGFLTTHQSLSNYYTKQQVDNKFTATSSWANTTFLTKNSADGLYYPLNTNPKGYLTESDISADKWNSVYTTVNTASGGWNLISSVSALTGIRNFEKIVVDIGTQDPIVIRATGSADNLSFIQGDNILFTKEGLGVKLSAKDTTYTSGNYIVIGDNNSINAVGLQPSGDYVSATDFNDFKEQVNEEFEQTSAWVEENFLSANALDEIKNLSAKWDAASDEVTSHSANWNSVYETVKTNSGDWEEITKVKTFKTIGGIDATTSADTLEFSAGENIKIGINEGKIYVSSHDTTYDENDFISASHLDNIVSVSSNVTSNSADWSSAARALEASADKWNTTHEQFNTSSVKWNELYDEYQVSSKLWNETTNRVDLSGEEWDKVVDKLDKDDFDAWSAKTTDWDVSAYSGVSPISIEQHKVSIDLSEYYKKTETSGSDELDTKFGEIEDRFEPIETDVATLKEFSAHNVVESSNQYIDVQSGTNKFTLTFTSGDLATRTWVGEQLADFGGFVLSTPTGDDHHPDVVNPSNKKVYLINDQSSPSPDQYREWIVTGTNPNTGWLCIGDTTMDLSDYYQKNETSSRNEISTEFTNTSAWANDTFQPIGNYVTSGDYITAGPAWVLVNDDNNIQWSGLDVSELGKKYIVKSTNGSVKVGSATVGNVVTYDLSADNMPTISSEYMLSNYNSATNKYELSGAKIVGENGISAEYNTATNEWNVGLDDYNNIGFAKYSSSANVYTASAVVDGYTEDLNVNPTKITLYNDQILLKTGFYHVDVQTNFTIANPDNNYYNVFVKSIPNAASITQMIDGSYAHTETVDLSFDIRITNDDTPLEISVENFKTNETFAISNLNIHEIVSMPSQIEGGAGNYQAGNGISIVNDAIEAKLGNGLEIDGSNAIQVKLGAGLKFDDTQGVQAITIDNKVEEVVETVDKLQEELDTKITDNFPPAMITLANLQVATGTQYAPSNGGMLIGYLFTCPITHNIYVNNEKYKTRIGIYTKQWSGDNKKVILGIYEYDPDYNEGGQVGRTVALCDTGIIDLQQGYAEYDIKNVGKDASSVMTPGKFYYATIYLSYKAGDTNGITLFGAPGYNTQVNNLKPGITITNVNCIHASLYEGLDGYSPNLNFDQMGFSWQYNSYPPDPDTQDSSQDIVEAHAAGRPYFAIRNVKITGN